MKEEDVKKINEFLNQADLNSDDEVLRSLTLGADQKLNQLVQEKQQVVSQIQELNKKLENLEFSIIASEGRREGYLDLILGRYKEREEKVDDDG